MGRDLLADEQILGEDGVEMHQVNALQHLHFPLRRGKVPFDGLRVPRGRPV
jgi:hypothetical protein